MRLESKRLYKGCMMMISRVKWEFPTPESEWIVIGCDNGFDVDTVQTLIDNRYDEPEILQVIDQRHAGPISRSTAAQSAKDNLKDRPIILCDPNFLSFIYIDPKGLLRQGSIPTR